MPGFFNNLALYNQYRDNRINGRAIPMAEQGMYMHNTVPKAASGRRWEIVKQFSGPSHAQGGILIEVGDGYVKQINSKKHSPDDIAKNGSVWKDIGAGAYGIGEGLLDTITMGATDQLTDAGYKALQKAGGSTESQMRQQNSIRGYGTTAGAVGGAFLTGGATTGSAIQQGTKGLGQGISEGSPNSKAAKQIGTWLPVAGQIGGMAMGNAGFGNSTGTAASIGKFSQYANKTAPALNVAAGALNTAQMANQPEAGQQGVGINPAMISQSMSMLEAIQRMRNQQNKASHQNKVNTLKTQDRTVFSQTPPGSTETDDSYLSSANTGINNYNYLNDLRQYGINV